MFVKTLPGEGMLPSLITAARRCSLDEFLRIYEPGSAQSWVSGTGETLLHFALQNGEPANRVAIAMRLLDDNADAAALVPPEQYTTLHLLFAHNSHDFQAEAPLLERLIAGGADVNMVAGRGWGTPLQALASLGKYSDDELEPFYNVLFARPGLDLLRAGKSGRSTLESAKLLGPRRQNLAARMEDYLNAYGITTENS
ncbi:hypothetical protein [Sanguibacter suaedae]|uniref:Ankyrin repeat domain-containing protein n=1 Tax=Sanguibacter suaedae TaxID=2795737 RepID=A0A934I7Q4_9MICO|nr:hypothetical protein [Sanguibacter suaedae]MBI9114692.1 hypothetical protein [Sanguibacter suaedae]